MTKPLCFILMPFCQKPDGRGGVIDFDAVYGELLRPAILAADLEPIRADEEQTGGVIHMKLGKSSYHNKQSCRPPCGGADATVSCQPWHALAGRCLGFGLARY